MGTLCFQIRFGNPLVSKDQAAWLFQTTAVQLRHLYSSVLSSSKPNLEHPLEQYLVVTSLWQVLESSDPICIPLLNSFVQLV